MKPLPFIAALAISAATVFGADKAEIPHYPNQPSINNALKELAKAQDKIASDQTEAVAALKKAQVSLDNAMKDKGGFRTTAVRLVKQAIRHLEANDTATATNEIADAFQATKRAGDVGARVR